MPSLDSWLRRSPRLTALRIALEILRHYPAILNLAVERVTTIGRQDYGDTSFHKLPSELRHERFCEYADAIFYLKAEDRARHRGTD